MRARDEGAPWSEGEEMKEQCLSPARMPKAASVLDATHVDFANLETDLRMNELKRLRNRMRM